MMVNGLRDYIVEVANLTDQVCHNLESFMYNYTIFFIALGQRLFAITIEFLQYSLINIVS